MSEVYQQAGAYMPRDDAGFRSWLHNFSSMISQDPCRFGLTQADADVIARHFRDYDALWQKCQQPGNRTTSSR